MLPKASASAFLSGKNITINGRAYAAVIGQTVDAPDIDAVVLEANNWFITGTNDSLCTGTTAQRLAIPACQIKPAAQYLDTTLGYIAVYDGLTWRNPATGAAV